MSFEFWDPFERLDEFRRSTNRMFDELFAELPQSTAGEEAIAFQPEVDLVETNDEFRFYLSVPGLVEDDILIEVAGRDLTIRGERRLPYDSDQRCAQLKEWRYGFFERHFELSSTVSINSVRADYDAGVLTIVVEKMVSGMGDPRMRTDGSRSPYGDFDHEAQQ